MVLKSWYQDMTATDCLSGHVSWNDMITYIKHSACLDFTIYSTCTDTGEAFKFTTNSIAIEGDRAIYINDDETYIGHGAGDNITSGHSNTLIGYNAGHTLTTQNSCVLIGYEAGKYNTRPSIVAIGYQALVYNRGSGNTANGYNALRGNTTGEYNTANGYNALSTNISGGYNTANGTFALYKNTTGNFNTANGMYALSANTTGLSNTANGMYALYKNTTGSGNTANGYNAGYNGTTTDGGVYLGYEAGYNNTTANRLYINNSNSAYPLIYGEFDNNAVKFGDNNAYWFAQILHENGGGQVFLKECTTPTAQAGHGAIYTKADNHLYFQDGDGNEHQVV